MINNKDYLKANHLLSLDALFTEVSFIWINIIIEQASMQEKELNETSESHTITVMLYSHICFCLNVVAVFVS